MPPSVAAARRSSRSTAEPSQFRLACPRGARPPGGVEHHPCSLAPPPPAVDPAVVGHLECSPAAGPQDPTDLAHVSKRDPRIRDVLEDDVAQANVGLCVRHSRQRGPVPVKPRHVLQVRVVLTRPEDHLAGHVERDDAGGARGDRAGEPADPAPDLDHRVPFGQLGADRFEQLVDPPRPVRPERMLVGGVVVELVVDEEQRVLARPPVPEVAHLARRHDGEHVSRGGQV